MTAEEKSAKERDITLVCCRGHKTQVTTEQPISSPDFVPEGHWPRCNQCGAFWMYATDGQKIHPLCQVVGIGTAPTPMPRI